MQTLWKTALFTTFLALMGMSNEHDCSRVPSLGPGLEDTVQTADGLSRAVGGESVPPTCPVPEEGSAEADNLAEVESAQKGIGPMILAAINQFKRHIYREGGTALQSTDVADSCGRRAFEREIGQCQDQQEEIKKILGEDPTDFFDHAFKPLVESYTIGPEGLFSSRSQGGCLNGPASTLKQ